MYMAFVCGCSMWSASFVFSSLEAFHVLARFLFYHFMRCLTNPDLINGKDQIVYLAASIFLRPISLSL